MRIIAWVRGTDTTARGLIEHRRIQEGFLSPGGQTESTTKDIIGFHRQKSNSAGNIFPKYPCFLGDFHVRPLDIHPVATFPTHHAAVLCPPTGRAGFPAFRPAKPATARVANQGR